MPDSKISQIRGIYGIFGPNGSVYVGSAVCIARRIRVHRKHLNSGSHHCHHLQHAWKKYGEQAFEFRILEPCEGLAACELIPREQYWMDVYRGHLYNDAPSAGSLAGYRFDRKVVEARAAKMRTFRHSEETKQRISDMAKGRPAHNKGHALSVEHRAKLSVAASSRAPASSATREKQGANMRRRFATGWKPPARKTRRFDANDQQKLKEMYERDPQVSVTAIAKAIGGVKRHTVSKYLKLAGVDISQRTIKRPSPNEIERRNLRLAKAKLSKEQVAAVRNLSASGRSISKLAADFKVSKPVIRRVVRNQSPYNDAVFVTSAS